MYDLKMDLGVWLRGGAYMDGLKDTAWVRLANEKGMEGHIPIQKALVCVCIFITWVYDARDSIRWPG